MDVGPGEVHPLVLLFAFILALLVFFLPRRHLKTMFTVLLMGVISYFLLITVAEMPPFGEPGNPSNNEVAARYLDQGIADTGVPNVIAGIILDYRATDTLGEATVIFVAIAAVIATIKAHDSVSPASGSGDPGSRNQNDSGKLEKAGKSGKREDE